MGKLYTRMSGVLLLVAIYVTDALRIATFPTILLVTTLFRLGLNVSSTRLIFPTSPVTSSALARAGSISKPVAAWGVMRLAERAGGVTSMPTSSTLVSRS